MSAPAVRFAVTSRDGVAVNERFHRAADYFVFELAEVAAARPRFIERRHRPPAAGRVFRDFAALATLLADCSWVVSLGFTGEARRELGNRGFRILEARSTVEAVAQEIARELARGVGLECRAVALPT